MLSSVVRISKKIRKCIISYKIFIKFYFALFLLKLRKSGQNIENSLNFGYILGHIKTLLGRRLNVPVRMCIKYIA